MGPSARAILLVSLVVLAAGCCPTPTAGPVDARFDGAAVEARVAVVTDGEPAADGAWTARTLADGASLLLRPAEGVFIAPHARLYLVGHWFDENTLFVASAHPLDDAGDVPPAGPSAPDDDRL